MKVEVQFGSAFALAVVKLAPNEGVRVDAGAMVSMSPDLTVETSAQGGILKALGRSLFGGESFFQNTFRAGGGGGEITLAPPLPGDISVLEMGGETYLLQSGAYLASSEGVSLDTKWTGARTFFSREGLVMLRTSGQGTVVVSSYGAIFERNLAAGERYKVDTGHLVAFTESVGYSVQRVGGLKSTLFSGEGLVVELTGPGRLLMQTRSEDALVSWLIPQLPFQRQGTGGHDN
jgi:uncharacterized protein (TIGR00266 family)